MSAPTLTRQAAPAQRVTPAKPRNRFFQRRPRRDRRALLDQALAPAPVGRAGRAQDDIARVLRMIAVIVVALLVHVLGVTYVQHAAGQQRLYQQLRQSLAEGSVPVSQVRTVDAELAPPEAPASAPSSSQPATDPAQSQTKVEMVPPGTPMALLEIPSIDRRLVVVEGTTSRQTAMGPGHLRASALPGQEGVSVIMARAALYGGDFYDLPSLEVGDRMTVTTGQGRFTYAVTAHRAAGDPLPPVLKPGESRLTLTTASGPAYAPDGVLRVDTKLVDKKALPRPAAVLFPASTPEAEQAMGKDLSGLLPAIFLIQALIAAAIGVLWLWHRWGRLQTWIVGFPVLAAVGIALATQLSYYLPNLL